MIFKTSRANLKALVWAALTTAVVGTCSATSKCPPCRVNAVAGLGVTPGQRPWPNIVSGQRQLINSLTPVHYPASKSIWLDDIHPGSAKRPWWMQPRQDPWSQQSLDKNAPSPPPFNDTVDDRMRWQCGYSYIVMTPNTYHASKAYPVVIFLHGGVNLHVVMPVLKSYEFHVPQSDPYIYVAPTKLEADWDPKKVMDVLADVKQHLNVDENRVYLTGLSMGGRGTFIVAAALPNTFAAILALSPHHAPYSYLPLAPDVAHLPIWLSHGTADMVSSYYMAVEMKDALQRLGAKIKWTSRTWVGHCCWNVVYSNPATFAWLLSWQRSVTSTSGVTSTSVVPTTTTILTTSTSTSITSTTTMTTTTMTTTTSTSSTPGGMGIQSGDTIFLKTHSGKGYHIDVEGNAVQARYESQGTWQAITIEKRDGGSVNSGDAVYLKAHTGKHIDVTGNDVQARWNDMGTWQAMVIEKRIGNGAVLPGDSVCFKAHTGKHLDVQGATVQARFNDCGDWQAMLVQKEEVGAVFSGISIHLLAHTGKRIEVEGNAVQARWSEAGQWQTFVITNYGGRAIFSGDTVFLKAHTGALVDVEGVAVQARWNDWGSWQGLVIERKDGSGAVMPGDTIFLRAHTGKIVEVEGDAVQARWDAREVWQSLVIERSALRRLTETAMDDSAIGVAISTVFV